MDKGPDNISANVKNFENETAERLFNSWNENLKSGDSEQIAKSYLPDGELFGTVSSQIRKGREDIKKYFEHFLKGNPTGKVIERNVRFVTPSYLLDEGVYDFELEKENGEKETVRARFTFLWHKDDDGVWKIKHHHSAVKNEKNENLNEQIGIDFENEEIEFGTDEDLGNGINLRTGFLKQPDGSVLRFTFLFKNKDDKEEVIYKQISERPEGHGV